MARLTCLLLLAVTAGCALAGSPYIKGGSDAEMGAWPWQGSVQFMFGQLHECGAAIISDKFILTAAHCIDNSPFARHLIAGLYNTEDWSQGQPEKHHFHSVQKHPDYERFKNDLSVIELYDAVNMSNPYIDKIAMAPEGADYEGQSCYITGWGATKEGSKEMSGPLQQAEVVVMSNKVCKETWGDLITDGQVCVGGKGLVGTCGGDSGSPLVCKRPDGWELVGIASFGAANCDASKPSVFTRVSFYRDWIKSETGF